MQSLTKTEIHNFIENPMGTDLGIILFHIDI
jgi:hypothetical protein